MLIALLLVLALGVPPAEGWVRVTRRAQRLATTLFQSVATESTRYDYRTDLAELLRGSVDATEFTRLLKNVASKKERVVLSNGEKESLVRAAVAHMPALTSDSFSSCIWALGTLGCSVDNVLSSTNKAAFADVISKAADSNDAIEFQRLLVGLSKMGMQFSDLPAPQQRQLQDFVAQPTLSGREVSSIAYSLAVMKARTPGETAAALSPEMVEQLVSHFSRTADTMTGTGFANALFGLSHIGVTWTSLPSQIVIERLLSVSDDNSSMALSPEQVCNVVVSLTTMRASLQSASPALSAAVVGALDQVLPSLRPRELVNVVWSLGRLNYRWLPPGRRDEEGEEEEGQARRLQETLVKKLTKVASSPSSLQPFDVESIFVGMGTMHVPALELPTATQAALRALVLRGVETMNIFCLFNVICGLAKMNAAAAPDKQECEAPIVDDELSAALLSRVSAVFHTFLPEQLGPVVWALASLGYHKNSMPQETRQRLLAILSRMLARLPVRGCSYCLLGLSRMGFNWSEDFVAAYKSLPDGIPGASLILFPSLYLFCRMSLTISSPHTANPFSLSVELYLRRRVSMFREHDYAVLLYSLGLLGAPMPAFDATVREKIHYRATRVSGFLSARSTSNALLGLSRAGETWDAIGSEAQQAWVQALCATDAQPLGGADADRDEDSPLFESDSDSDLQLRSERLRGLSGMSKAELQQIIAAFEGLGMQRTALPEQLRTAFDGAVERCRI